MVGAVTAIVALLIPQGLLASAAAHGILTLAGIDPGIFGKGPRVGSRDWLFYMWVFNSISALVIGLAIVGLPAVRRGVRQMSRHGTAWTLARGVWLVPLLVLFVVVPAIIDPTQFHLPSPQRFALLIIDAALIGVFEELYARGLLIWGAGGVRRPVAALLTSSLLFGGLHIAGGLQENLDASLLNAAFATCLGLIFGSIRIAGGTLIGLMAVHGLWDLVLLSTTRDWVVDKPVTAAMLLGLIPAALLAAAYVRWGVRGARAGVHPPPVPAVLTES